MLRTISHGISHAMYFFLYTDIEEAFLLFDKDNSGSISIKELQAVMKQLGVNHTESEVKSMLKNIDKDGE